MDNQYKRPDVTIQDKCQVSHGSDCISDEGRPAIHPLQCITLVGMAMMGRPGCQVYELLESAR